MTAQTRWTRVKPSTSLRRILALLLIITVGACWPSASSQASSSAKWDWEIKKAAKRWLPDVPWKLWKAQLYQESRLDPDAVSPVGARGLAQFMPGTWDDVARQMNFSTGISPHDPDVAIEAGAYYMSKLRYTWRRNRTSMERHPLAQASYNAGTGNILKAQARCDNARMWPEIAPCLVMVTGEANSHETRTYVERIARWWKQMELE